MNFNLTRRKMIQSSAAMFASQFVGCGSRQTHDYQVVDAYIRNALPAGDTPGIAACVLRRDAVEWSAGYGWADIDNKVPMTPDTILNTASISKTFVATAIMQLRDEGRFELDDAVDAYLPFPVRNPLYPIMPITFRQLLTHTSSINDGPAYTPSYACGDPTLDLMDWLQSYFDPDGANYSASDNFLSLRPGVIEPPRQTMAYSNVGFGLLGGLVDQISICDLKDDTDMLLKVELPGLVRDMLIGFVSDLMTRFDLNDNNLSQS